LNGCYGDGSTHSNPHIRGQPTSHYLDLTQFQKSITNEKNTGRT